MSTATDRARRAARHRRALVATAVTAALVVGACSSDDESATPTDGSLPAEVGDTTPDGSTELPTRSTVADPVAEVTGPITGGDHGVPFTPVPPALAEAHGYVEEEFFIAGSATAYQPAAGAEWGEDGVWPAEPATTADYTTRLLVRRPADPTAFSGTVVVEWLNVSAGMDSDPVFGQAGVELLRTGDVWVGVSAQVVGIEGGGARIPIEGIDIQPLKTWDPERYGGLEHPGDDYSYDMFTQVAQVVRQPGDVDPLGGLEPRWVLAAGESQSAMRMTTYVNAVHPLVEVFDGFLVHSRGGSGAPLSAEPMPTMTHLRDDLDVPVLQLETETDLFGLGFHAARQPDHDLLRTWELAGTAHADVTTLEYGAESGAVWAPPDVSLDLGAMCPTINDGPQRYGVRLALASLEGWVRDGLTPPSAEPIEVVDGAVARDDDGLARGGLRYPDVTVPVATLSGDAPPGSDMFCSLFGATTPFPPDELAERYGSSDAYVAEVEAAAEELEVAGLLLDADVPEVLDRARSVDIGG